MGRYPGHWAWSMYGFKEGDGEDVTLWVECDTFNLLSPVSSVIWVSRLGLVKVMVLRRSWLAVSKLKVR